MSDKIRNVQDVAARNLCCGCGACAYVSGGRITMVDDVDAGLRPRSSEREGGANDEEVLDACPGYQLEQDPPPPAANTKLAKTWGPVLELWEGVATDPESIEVADNVERP